MKARLLVDFYDLQPGNRMDLFSKKKLTGKELYKKVDTEIKEASKNVYKQKFIWCQNQQIDRGTLHTRAHRRHLGLQLKCRKSYQGQS